MMIRLMIIQIKHRWNQMQNPMDMESTGNPSTMSLVSNDPSGWPQIDLNLVSSYVAGLNY
ncbi:hypothetical protein CY34DRAFT_806186 [Suillus luteus UH-Slu-Lm8-n1]|uniref:Uncharacterized protein n=1 Tax=Suillus luteus UH-Slu-Lm8-n1 TaxID=930992 RepID=A0A0D0AHI0_9AGAM|nr:hypothetical protein CY34DRAFT_806186 [Suillus luteus UH-Slu-Lm8-n1]